MTEMVITKRKQIKPSHYKISLLVLIYQFSRGTFCLTASKIQFEMADIFSKQNDNNPGPLVASVQIPMNF